MQTQHWVSGTRAHVSSYRMQRESDVCESVCEAGVLVHGGCRCRACHLCVCAQSVCVCVRARNHQQRARSRVGGTAGLCLLPVRSAQPQTRARRRRLSTLWSRSPLTPPTKGAASLGAAEMGQATRRELALGLRSAEASLAATRGRSRWRRGGAGARETQRRRLPSRSDDDDDRWFLFVNGVWPIS